jgi:hypothetical protein
MTSLQRWAWSHPRLTAPLRATWRAIRFGLRSIDGLSAPRRAIYGEVFDGSWYLADNPDVAASEVDALTHYLASGWREGRDQIRSSMSRGTWVPTRRSAGARSSR